jgi:nucleoside phosphorylase
VFVLRKRKTREENVKGKEKHIIGNDDMFRLLFGIGREEVRKNVILISFLPVEKFGNTNAERKVFKGRLYSGINFLTENGGYTVIKTPLGGTLAGDCVLFLAKTGIKRIIYAGSCGGVGSSRIGDVFIGTKAFYGGGFSDYYHPGKGIDNILSSGSFFKASPPLVEEILSINAGTPENGDGLKQGSIFTIGSLAAETDDVLEKIGSLGFDGIDMELASVYHAAEILKAEAVGILFSSDLPLEKPFWKRSSSGEKEKLKTAVKRVIKLASLSANMIA